MVTMKDACVFCDLLKKARSILGISKKVVSDRTGININSIYLWESGISLPALIHLDLISSVYDLDQEEVKKAYFLSKSARKLEREARRGLKRKKFEPTETACSSDLISQALNAHKPIVSYRGTYYRLLAKGK